MHYSIYATIGSILFLTILFIICLSKKNNMNSRHKMFNISIGIAYVALISEVIYANLYAYSNYIKLADFLLRIHWLLAFFWLDTLLSFVICFIEKYNDVKKLLDIKFVKINLVVLSILKIIYMFIPFSKIDPNCINYIPGPAAYFGFGYISYIMLLIILYERTSPKKNRSTFSCVFIILFEGFLIILCQLLINNIALYGCVIVSIMFGVYATAENPDLDVIEDLKELKDNIDSSSRIKTDVILSMSHDIRSPMNAIVNYSEELKNITELNDDLIKIDINNILSSGKNLLNIIGDVLDASSQNTNNNDQFIDSYQLKTIIDDLVNITKTRIGKKQINIITNIDQNVPLVLNGNSTKIYRILMNILSNSAKYTEVGRITISISSSRIDNSDSVVLHFKISDTGFGIKDEDKPKIFSRFSRLNDATSQNIEGTGLGLVNTKKNVESIGGKIWFESVYGAGTSFFVDIPQRIASEVDNIQISKDARLSENLVNYSNNKVLIVDDNTLNIEVISRLLERYGFNVDYVCSSDDCIVKIKEENKYNLIFMNVFLNGENGIELLKILKQLNEIYEIPPVIALSSNVTSGSKEKYLKEGYDEYLSKPIDINNLDRIINLFLKND